MKFAIADALSLSSFALVVHLSIILTNESPILLANGFSTSCRTATKGSECHRQHHIRQSERSKQNIAFYASHCPLKMALDNSNAFASPPSTDNSTDNDIDNTEKSNTVEFPPPLSPTQRIKRALEFYRRVLPVLGAYKVKEIELSLRRKTLGEDAVTEVEEEEAWNHLDDWGSTRISETIQEMKGFYVKSGQVISTRVDLFPEAYTTKLQTLQDGLDPMPFDLVVTVVSQELLDGAPLSELFKTFETEPLGSASIAQVHKATLLNGRTVAVKLQRPNVEPKLKGDVANLKRFSKVLANALPIDYYSIFSELGKALENELDFLAEAQAMRKIDYAVSHNNDGTLSDNRPVWIPLPVGELVSKRVLVMDFVEGVPLNRLQEIIKKKGIEPGSPEAKLGGKRILDSLAAAFERMIFAAGFVHGDPHPGNILIGKSGEVSLIDCGQFKAINRQQRMQIAAVVLAVEEYQQCKALGQKVATEQAKDRLAGLVLKFGVEVFDGDKNNNDLPAAIALLLFGDIKQELPGGYSTNELSENSPIKRIKFFPQELVLLGRAAVILKGIASMLDVPFSLAEKWGPGARLAMESSLEPSLPLWGKEGIDATGEMRSADVETNGKAKKLRFRQVASLFKEWGKQKGGRVAQRVVMKLPKKWRSKLLTIIAERQERRE